MVTEVDEPEGSMLREITGQRQILCDFTICGPLKKQIHHSSNSREEKETKGIQIEKEVKVAIVCK